MYDVVQVAVRGARLLLELLQLERAELVPGLRVLRLEVARLPVEVERLRAPLERDQHPQRFDRERIERVRRLAPRRAPSRALPLDEGVVRRVEARSASQGEAREYSAASAQTPTARRRATGAHDGRGGRDTARRRRGTAAPGRRRSPSRCRRTNGATQSATPASSASHGDACARGARSRSPPQQSPRVEQEADDARLAQELQRHRVRLESPRAALSRSRRSVSPNVPAPVPSHGMVDERVPRLLPPAPAVARARRWRSGPACSATCALTGFENSCQRSLTKSPGPPARTTRQRAASNRRARREPPRRARTTRGSTARVTTNAARSTTTTAPTSEHAPKSEPVLHAHVVRLPFVADARQEQRDARDERADDPRDRERPDRLEPRPGRTRATRAPRATVSTIPTREYVSTATTSARVQQQRTASTRPRSCREPQSQNPSGTDAAASNASSFQ